MCILTTSLLLFVSSALFAAEGGVRVVASVSQIYADEQAKTDRGYVWLQIHSPVEFQGMQLAMVLEDRDRAAIRLEFPMGSIWELRLSESTRTTLQKAKRDEERIQQTIDSGVPIETISSFVVWPQLAVGELLALPIRRSIE